MCSGAIIICIRGGGVFEVPPPIEDRVKDSPIETTFFLAYEDEDEKYNWKYNLQLKIDTSKDSAWKNFTVSYM